MSGPFPPLSALLYIISRVIYIAPRPARIRLFPNGGKAPAAFFKVKNAVIL